MRGGEEGGVRGGEEGCVANCYLSKRERNHIK